MKKNILLLLAALFGLGIANVRGFDLEPGKKYVFAHDTPWFRPEDSSVFTEWYYDYPMLSVKDTPTTSDDSTHEELVMAESLGIDGLFLDFGAGLNGTAAQWSWILPVFLKAAEGTKVNVGFCIDLPASAEYWASEIIRLLKENGSHPNYPRYQGKYVIATYCYMPMTPETWAEIYRITHEAGFDIFVMANMAPLPNVDIETDELEKYKDVFDCAYLFDSPGHPNQPPAVTNKVMSEFCGRIGKMFMPTLHPGYYGAWRVGNDFYGPFRGFDQLYDTFRCAMQYAGDAKWLHITSWNDMMETAVIEKAFSFGLTHTIGYYAHAFKGEAVVADAPDVLVAYHREEIPGTLLRIELMNLPSKGQEEIIVTGTLRDADGRVVARLPERTFQPEQLERAEYLVPTEEFAYSPYLVPQIAVKAGAWSRTVDYPAVLFVSSWIQNASTVNMPVNRLLPASFRPQFSVRQNGNVITANVAFDSPEPLRRIILCRNEMPIALFTPDLNEKDVILPGSIGGVQSPIDITVTNGRFVRAVKKGQRNNHPKYLTFKWTPETLFTDNSSSAPLGFVLAGTEEMTLHIVQRNTGESMDIRAADLRKAKQIPTEICTFYSRMDMTQRNDEPLNATSGNYSLSIFGDVPREFDSFYLRFETMDGKVWLSEPVYPFAPESTTCYRYILVTATGMETSSAGAGHAYLGMPEFITEGADAVFHASNRRLRTCLSRLGCREIVYHFDGNGVDASGDYLLYNVPKELFADEGVDGSAGSLRFSGKGNLRTHSRTWPLGGFGTISFSLKPDKVGGAKQSVIQKDGWYDGLSFILLEDGRIQVRREYIANPAEQWNVSADVAESKTPLKAGEWTKVETRADAATLSLFINGKEEDCVPLAPIRSYGNGRVYLGGGRANADWPAGKDFEDYSGLLDELVIRGL